MLLPTMVSAAVRNHRSIEHESFQPSSMDSSPHRKLLLDGFFDYWPSKCTETKVLVSGADLFNPQFAFSTYTSDPAPGDREVFNLHLYEPETFVANPTSPDQIILGYVNEELVYLPPADFPSELDCLGHEVWTFYDPETEALTGQVSDQYTCFGKNTLITGGTMSFACAEGSVKQLEKTDDFYEGSGYAIFNIVNCGKCDNKSFY